MKLVCLLVVCISLFVTGNSSETKTEFNLQNHLTMMMRFKTKTHTMLENLYLSANRVEMKKSSVKRRASSRRKVVRTNTSSHFSSLKGMKKMMKLKNKDYVQFRYKTYGEIVKTLEELAKKYPAYLKLTTAQKLYKLPHPGGYCANDKKT
jgi:hypothetical protein